jgi:hypothetical protein
VKSHETGDIPDARKYLNVGPRVHSVISPQIIASSRWSCISLAGIFFVTEAEASADDHHANLAAFHPRIANDPGNAQAGAGRPGGGDRCAGVGEED